MPIALAALRNGDRASEVAQDVVVDVLRGLGGLKNHDAFDAWVRRIAVRHTRRAMGRWALRRAREEPIDVDIEGGGDGQEQALLRVSVRQALATLPPRQRLALILRYLHDLTDAEIADALGCREGTAGSLLSRGRATLRDDPGLQALAGTRGRKSP